MNPLTADISPFNPETGRPRLPTRKTAASFRLFQKPEPKAAAFSDTKKPPFPKEQRLL